jgi:hypothetical protein
MRTRPRVRAFVGARRGAGYRRGPLTGQAKKSRQRGGRGAFGARRNFDIGCSTRAAPAKTQSTIAEACAVLSRPMTFQIWRGFCSKNLKPICGSGRPILAAAYWYSGGQPNVCHVAEHGKQQIIQKTQPAPDIPAFRFSGRTIGSRGGARAMPGCRLCAAIAD